MKTKPIADADAIAEQFVRDIANLSCLRGQRLSVDTSGITREQRDRILSLRRRILCPMHGVTVDSGNGPEPVETGNVPELADLFTELTRTGSGNGQRQVAKLGEKP